MEEKDSDAVVGNEMPATAILKKEKYFKSCEVESRVEFFKCGDLQERLKSLSSIKKWAYVLHDKDDTAPHYHIYLKFNSGIKADVIAGWFGLQSSQVQKIKSNDAGLLAYLTHKNQPNKYQYDDSEVVANFDVATEIKNASIIGNFEEYSYSQMLDYVNTLSPHERIKVYGVLEKHWRHQCKMLAKQTERNIDVMFVTGGSGDGKSTYSRRLCKGLGYDYCISSSKNDPLQDYMGQNALILDDLRDEHIEFVDLLKLLDNHVSSSFRSRFNNKVFNGKLIIITASNKLSTWYSKIKYSNTESMKQLYRRIGSYVIVKRDKIKVFSEVDDNTGEPKGKLVEYINDLHLFKIEVNKPKFDIFEAFDKCANRVGCNYEKTLIELSEEEGKNIGFE